MFARIENGVVVEYPLTEHDLRSRFKTTSFTTDFASGLPEGYVQVMRTGVPQAGEGYAVNESRPAYIDNMWVQVFSIDSVGTPEEIAIKDAEVLAKNWRELREERDERIYQCNFRLERHREQKELGIPTTMSDAEYTLWLQYRQQLRDLPTIVENVAIFNSWPTPPNELSIASL
jgi:hypothetical protein